MKKLLFGLIAFTLFSVNSYSQKSKLIEPNFGENVNLVNQVFPAGSTNKCVFRLGRPSAHCFRWGVCEITIFGWEVYKTGYVNLTIESPKSNPFVTIILSEPLDSKIFDTNFYVDEDIVSTEGKVTVIKGIYNIDNSIGKYGGYKVPLKLK